MELVDYNINKPSIVRVGRARRLVRIQKPLPGRVRTTGRVVKRNAKTVWVTAPGGRVIKRHIVKDNVRVSA